MTAAVSAAPSHHYKPVGSALEVMKCRAKEAVLVGPAGTGKSRAALEKLLGIGLRTPGVRMLALRKTLVSLSATGMVTWKEHVAKEAIAANIVKWFGGNPTEPGQYRFTNGSTLTVGGMDNPTKIMSSEYDVIYVQEATELSADEWEKCTTRLRNNRISFQQLLADCNPDKPTHWLKKRIDDGMTVGIASRHEDNPTLYRNGSWTPSGKYYIDTLAALTGVRRLRLFLGLWAAAEGVIYDTWDDSAHLLNRDQVAPAWRAERCPMGIPMSWPRYWAVDFGFTNPFVLQRWAVDPDGRLYLYAEQYRSRRLVSAHAADVMDQVAPAGENGRQWVEPKPRDVVTDHDAEGRETFVTETGRPTIAARKEVKDGIQAVQSRLSIADDGKPRLFIVRDSLLERDSMLADSKRPTCTYEELGGYIWDKPRDGAKDESREQPVKVDDHGMDAMRYMVMHLDRNATQWVRFLR